MARLTIVKVSTAVAWVRRRYWKGDLAKSMMAEDVCGDDLASKIVYGFISNPVCFPTNFVVTPISSRLLQTSVAASSTGNFVQMSGNDRISRKQGRETIA